VACARNVPRWCRASVLQPRAQASPVLGQALANLATGRTTVLSVHIYRRTRERGDGRLSPSTPLGAGWALPPLTSVLEP
jgi:hypothetical protein